MMEAKFYIYARGRWCELDTRSGRVEGCKERARFLYFKGGKLELARTAKVLRGLRALVAGTPGSVRDGPLLPQRRRRHRRRSRRERDSRHHSHHHCCVHHRCDVNANGLLAKPVLTAPPVTLPPPAPLPPPTQTPRKRRIILSEEESPQENVDKSLTNKEAPHTGRDIPVLRSVEANSEERKRLTRSAVKVRQNISIVVDSDSSEEVKSPSKTRNRKREIVSISDDAKEKRDKVAENKKNASKAVAEQIFLGLSDSDSEDSEQQSGVLEPGKELVIDENDVVVLRRYLATNGLVQKLDRFDNDDEYKKRFFYKLNPLVSLERCKSLENLLRQKMTLKEFARNLGLRSVAEVTPEKRYRMRATTKSARAAATDSETDKENIVKPKRRKLWNNDKELFNSATSRSSEVRPRQIPKPVLNEDSSKDTTDSDTEFKRRVREQLDRKSKQRATAAQREETATSVETEKGPRATRASMKGPGPLKEQNKPSDDKEKRNASRIESSEDVRRRTRSSDRGVRVRPGTRTELDKATGSSEQFEAKASPKKPVDKDKVPKVSENTPKIRNKKGRFTNEKGHFVKEGEKTIDEKVEEMRPAAVKIVRSVMAVKPVKFKASSVPAGREYTSLEDHAIIAWVSSGGRERKVNGNALWRQLQPAFSGLTGQTRSWHSLRNRYLRYLLPSLGRLALPPAQVSRLRAAAAAGVIKVRSVLPRRNSIFGAPSASSASRAARPRASPAPAPAQGAPASAKTAAPAPRSPRSPRRAPPSPSHSAAPRRRTRASAPPTPPASASSSANTHKRKAKKW